MSGDDLAILCSVCHRFDRERIQLRVENEELTRQLEQLNKAKVSVSRDHRTSLRHVTQRHVVTCSSHVSIYWTNN